MIGVIIIASRCISHTRNNLSVATPIAAVSSSMSRERDRSGRKKKRSATSVARAYPNACAERPPAYSDYESYQPTWRYNNNI